MKQVIDDIALMSKVTAAEHLKGMISFRIDRPASVSDSIAQQRFDALCNAVTYLTGETEFIVHTETRGIWTIRTE